MFIRFMVKHGETTWKCRETLSDMWALGLGALWRNTELEFLAAVKPEVFATRDETQVESITKTPCQPCHVSKARTYPRLRSYSFCSVWLLKTKTHTPKTHNGKAASTKSGYRELFKTSKSLKMGQLKSLEMISHKWVILCVLQSVQSSWQAYRRFHPLDQETC